MALRFLPLSAVLLALAACQGKPAETAKAPERPVLAQTVAFERISPERSFVATIRPRIESDLGFRVAGKVARRLVNVGEAVKAGQPLATLDETDFRLQREQADAEIRAATAAQAQAQAELKRVQSLIDRGWSTSANLERQQAASEEARGRLTRAERALSLSANSLSYATLSADADGVVTATQIEPGQVVTAGLTAIRIARMGEKEAVIAVPESQVGAVQDGVAAITLWSNPDRRYEASLRELSPSADPTTRTYLARFSIPKAGPEVQLGMTATVTVGAANGDKAARLPLSALFNQGGGPSVWVIDVDGRPTLRPVQVVSYGSQEVLIGSGLTDREKVVTLGVQKLDAAQRVRIVQALQF